MQIEELLNEQSPNYESRIQKVQMLLSDIQHTIRSLPPTASLFAADLQDVLKQHPTVRIPFPTSAALPSAQLRYGFSPPTRVELIGSFSLHTDIRHDQNSCIDLSVTMPAHLFEERDFLDYRYIHKRAYYLARLAGGLEAGLGDSIQLAYSYQNDNELQPCIMVTRSETHAKAGYRWNRVRILVGPPSNAFKRQKLQPWTSCIRDRTNENDADLNRSKTPTPFYNGTVVSDCLFDSYHSLLTKTSHSVPGFRDACKLMRLWLRQRDFASGLKSGGFGCFESACCLALLLQGNSQISYSTLSKNSDCLQLFSSLLQFLAHRDTVREPLALGNTAETLPTLYLQSPLLYDAERHHNVLFKMTLASYRSLRMAAQTSVEALAQPEALKLYPIFIAKMGSVFVRYDHVLEGKFASTSLMMPQRMNALYNALTTALTDRAHLVDIRFQDTASTEWTCSMPSPSIDTEHRILIGLITDSTEAVRRVDLGPSAEETNRTKEFRDFWGEKADLRRFANGEIRESVTWSKPMDDGDILNEIVTHIIKRHFPEGTINLSRCLGETFSKVLRPHSIAAQALRSFEKVEMAFKQLQECIWTVSGHPLRLRQISASGAGVRYASLKADGMYSSLHSCNDFDVIIQFEGSMRWPEDMEAIQHTQVALLSKIREGGSRKYRVFAFESKLLGCEPIGCFIQIEDLSRSRRIAARTHDQGQVFAFEGQRARGWCAVCT
jgi:U3 small nucleolar RNA-associated protein 22